MSELQPSRERWLVDEPAEGYIHAKRADRSLCTIRANKRTNLLQRVSLVCDAQKHIRFSSTAVTRCT